jgi:hypothetical protein
LGGNDGARCYLQNFSLISLAIMFIGVAETPYGKQTQPQRHYAVTPRLTTDTDFVSEKYNSTRTLNPFPSHSSCRALRLLRSSFQNDRVLLGSCAPFNEDTSEISSYMAKKRTREKFEYSDGCSLRGRTSYESSIVSCNKEQHVHASSALPAMQSCFEPTGDGIYCMPSMPSKCGVTVVCVFTWRCFEDTVAVLS